MTKFKSPKVNYGYLRIFAWTAVAMISIALGGMYTYLFIVMYIGMALADQYLKTDERNHARENVRAVSDIKFYRYITYMQLPVQLVCLFFVGWRITDIDTQWYERFGMIIASGIIFGNIGINVAHELIHKNIFFERVIGGILLSMTCYGTFKIEHVRWHHVHVATPIDPSTSKFGQSLYAFLWRVYRTNFRNGFRLEAERLQEQGLPTLHWRNEALLWSILSLLIAGVMYLTFGLAGVIYFIVQSFIAITSLEAINYVEHYGLERKLLEDGSYEPVNHQHSWNSSHLLSNYGLLNLPRHSDHHAFPRRRYQVLRHYDDSPQLPAGYATMIVLAFFPRIWRKVMDPLVMEHRERNGYS